jgi:hypothetical protein
MPHTLRKHQEKRETTTVVELIIVWSEIDMSIILITMLLVVFFACQSPGIFPDLGCDESLLEESRWSSVAVSEWVDMDEYEMDICGIVEYLWYREILSQELSYIREELSHPLSDILCLDREIDESSTPKYSYSVSSIVSSQWWNQECRWWYLMRMEEVFFCQYMILSILIRYYEILYLGHIFGGIFGQFRILIWVQIQGIALDIRRVYARWLRQIGEVDHLSSLHIVSYTSLEIWTWCSIAIEMSRGEEIHRQIIEKIRWFASEKSEIKSSYRRFLLSDGLWGGTSHPRYTARS